MKEYQFLVVDDDTELRKMLVRVLDNFDYLSQDRSNVREASSGDEAVEMYKRSPAEGSVLNLIK